MPRALALAKLTVPKLGRVLTRTRLLKQLDRLAHHKFIWIAAPAGSGKTTLVAEYLKSRKRAHLWYQVDADDADPASFIYYLAQAAERFRRRRLPLPLLTPEYLPGLETFARNFFRDLFARLRHKGILVLDNYQEIAPGSAVHRMLEAGLREIPDGINVIVLSRADPQAEFARLLTDNHLQHMGRDDLRLTLPEAQAIGRLRLGRQAPHKKVIERLHADTNGWMAGLVLLLEQPKHDPDAEGMFPAQPERLFEYFAGEILAKSDPALQLFLLKTTLLPRMSVAAAQSLTGRAEAGDIIEDLARRNYFTVRHASGGEVAYEYHPLFRAFLCKHAQMRLAPAELAALQTRAAHLLEGSGQVEDAADLYRGASDWAALAALVRKHAARFVSEGRSNVIEKWLSAMPDEARSADGWLEYWFGACRLPFNPPQARAYFERAFARFELTGDAPGLYLAWAGVAESYIYASAVYSGLDPWIEKLPMLLARYPEPAIEAIGAHVAFGMFAALMARRPQHPDMPYWEGRARAAALGGANPRLRMLNGHHLVLYYTWWNTDLAKAEVIINLLRPLAQEPAVTPLVRAMWHSMEAIYYLMVARPGECLESVNQGLAVSEQHGVHVWDHILIGAGVWGSLTAMDPANAADFLARMAKRVNPAQFMNVAVYHNTAGIEAYWRGDIGTAVEHALTANERAGMCNVLVPQALCQIAAGRALCEAGDVTRSSEMLARVHETGVTIGSAYLQYLARLGQAALAFRGNDSRGALEYLKDGLGLGRRMGCFYYMWFNQQDLAKLCAQALANGIETEYVGQWISKRKLAPPLDVEHWPWPCRIYTLGRFSIVKDGQPLTLTGKGHKKPLDLLKTLIALGGREIGQEKLIEALWPEAEGDAARHAFETTLHRLRKLLGEDAPLLLKDGRLTLDARSCWVDGWAFERLLARLEELLRAGTLDTIEPLTHNLFDLYQGAFLHHESELPATLSLRERLRSRFLRVLKEIGRHHEAQQAWDRATDCYLRALEVEPLAEEFYRLLMHVYHALGRNAEGIAVYERCRKALHSLLGVAPSRETEALRLSLEAAGRA